VQKLNRVLCVGEQLSGLHRKLHVFCSDILHASGRDSCLLNCAAFAPELVLISAQVPDSHRIAEEVRLLLPRSEVLHLSDAAVERYLHGDYFRENAA
jgi:hypothetical protein